MPWVKLDDHIDEHPKIARVGPIGFALQVAALAYCNRTLTDGFVPYGVAERLLSFHVVENDGKRWTMARTSGHVGDDIDSEWVIALLLEAGMWDDAPGGYQIHDYEKYQPLKEAVEAERAKTAERVQRHRNARSNERRNVVTNPSETPPPVPVPDSVPENPNQEPSSPNGDIDAEFEKFWSGYPKRNDKRLHKGKAHSVWKRLNNAERERARTGVAHYLAACEQGLTIAADAFRWLRDKAFDDWQTPAARAPSSNGHHPYTDADQWTLEERGLA